MKPFFKKIESRVEQLLRYCLLQDNPKVEELENVLSDVKAFEKDVIFRINKADRKKAKKILYSAHKVLTNLIALISKSLDVLSDEKVFMTENQMKCLRELKSLITFTHDSIIQSSYKPSGDQHLIPQDYAQVLKGELTELFKNLLERVKAKVSDSEVIGFVEDVVYSMTNPQTHYSYEKKEYLESFYDELSNLLARIDSPTGDDLVSLLISHKFNHRRFLFLFKDYISEKMNEVDDIESKLKQLVSIKTSIIQNLPSSKRKLNPKSPSIKKSALKMINAEMSYIKLAYRPLHSVSQSIPVNNNIMVSFTVKQLAIFLHLQLDAGIILNKNARQLHQFVATHYRTGNIEKISDKSFKNAFYDFSMNDLEKVIEKLIVMLAKAQEKLTS